MQGMNEKVFRHSYHKNVDPYGQNGSVRPRHQSIEGYNPFLKGARFEEGIEL